MVCAITDGDHQPPPQSSLGVPFLVISDVNTGKIIFEKARFVPISYYNNLPLIRKACIGDILFTVTGSYGIVIPVTTERPFCFQRHIGLIKTIQCSEWISLVLQSDYVKNYCDACATGTAQKTVSLGSLRNLIIPVPPEQEQNRILHKAGVLCSMVDEISESLFEVNNSIQLSRTRVLDLAIRGKLVPQDPSDEPAIELLKRINPAFKPSDNLHYEDYPLGWQDVTLKEIISLYSGRDLEASSCNTEHRGIPYLVGASCIEGHSISVYRWTEHPEVIAKQNDVLLSCKGTVGEVLLNAIGDVHIARQFMAIRSRAPQLILPEYLELIIKASIEELKSAARGIIPGLSREDILEMRAGIPPLAEQKRILLRINEMEDSLSYISQSVSN